MREEKVLREKQKAGAEVNRHVGTSVTEIMMSQKKEGFPKSTPTIDIVLTKLKWKNFCFELHEAAGKQQANAER